MHSNSSPFIVLTPQWLLLYCGLGSYYFDHLMTDTPPFVTRFTRSHIFNWQIKGSKALLPILSSKIVIFPLFYLHLISLLEIYPSYPPTYSDVLLVCKITHLHIWQSCPKIPQRRMNWFEWEEGMWRCNLYCFPPIHITRPSPRLQCACIVTYFWQKQIKTNSFDWYKQTYKLYDTTRSFLIKILCCRFGITYK